MVRLTAPGEILLNCPPASVVDSLATTRRGQCCRPSHAQRATGDRRAMNLVVATLDVGLTAISIAARVPWRTLDNWNGGRTLSGRHPQ